MYNTKFKNKKSQIIDFKIKLKTLLKKYGELNRPNNAGKSQFLESFTKFKKYENVPF